MIESFAPRYFKCFADETFQFGALTLLTGVNGSGKSSLIQALLLARQAALGQPYVRLNGPSMLQLGQASDVFNQTIAGSDQSIDLDLALGDAQRARWRLRAMDGEALVLKVEVEVENPGLAEGLARCFHYLCAERVGPRAVSVRDSRPPESIEVGAQGEFVAQVLQERERERVRPECFHPRTKEEGDVVYLGKQVELWMRDLVPQIEFRTQSFEGTNAVALRMHLRGGTVEWLRPTNMAFGVTYALPIVVTGLLAQPGALFIVENPEAHLHPSGQSRIGRFLATVAAGGVQVLVETHSDHVLNGIRLAAALDDHPLRPEGVVIHHFSPDLPSGRRAMEISLTSNGGLSEWPPDFFDQSEKDLARLVKVRRRGGP